MKRLGEHRYVAAVSPIRRHLLDPWEAEIVDHSAPPEAAMRFDGVPITSASPSVARLRTRCLILLGSLMKKECPPASLIDELDRSLDQEQDRALFGLRRSSPAGADRSALPTAASLKGWRPARLPDGSRGILYAGRNSKGPHPALAIAVRTRSGDSWDAIISEVVERSAGHLPARTRRLDP